LHIIICLFLIQTGVVVVIIMILNLLFIYVIRWFLHGDLILNYGFVIVHFNLFAAAAAVNGLFMVLVIMMVIVMVLVAQYIILLNV
jgi:hypothetical protein